jgi:hypothetical protein
MWYEGHAGRRQPRRAMPFRQPANSTTILPRWVDVECGRQHRLSDGLLKRVIARELSRCSTV